MSIFLEIQRHRPILLRNENFFIFFPQILINNHKKVENVFQNIF